MLASPRWISTGPNGLEPRIDGTTGQAYRYPAVVWRYAFIEGLVLQKEISRMEEEASRLLAVDALAERVLAAGCTGIRFQHPGMSITGPHVEYDRTLTGVIAHRVGYLD